MRGPHYSLFSQSLLEDIFECMGLFVDGLKFSGGSYSLLPKTFIKEVTNMAHKHNVYVSRGDWAEHRLCKGPSSIKEYIEECKKLGFDTIELDVGSLGVPEETLLRYARFDFRVVVLELSHNLQSSLTSLIYPLKLTGRLGPM